MQTTTPPATDRRPRVAVLFGGRSGEHSISCLTAADVLRAVDRGRYDVLAVGIDRDGRWWRVGDDPATWTADGAPLDPATADVAQLVDDDARQLVPDTAVGDWGLLPLTSGRLAGGSGRQAVDVVFPLLHGPYGEDGTIQGLLELAGVPYVGSGVLASAAGMDKPTMKTLLRVAGLDLAEWVTVDAGTWQAGDRGDTVAAVDKLGWPVFVKPARAGSSLGVSRVADADGLDAAVVAAAQHDPRVIVEAAVRGREVECAVLDEEAGRPPAASVCGEIVLLGDRPFYDFEAKYLGSMRLVVPADLPSATADRVRAVAVAAFGALGCEGLARVDVFVDGDRVVVNEVNTMPGFTPQSVYPRLWGASGVDYPQLVDRLLRRALERPPGLR